MQKISLFRLHSVSAKLYYYLGKVLNIHTILLLQVQHTVPYPKLLSLVPKIFVHYCFHTALLLVLSEADLLKPLVDIKAEVPLFIVMLGLSSDKLPFCLLYLSRDLN